MTQLARALDSMISQREFENLPPQNQQKVVEEAALFSAEENQVLQVKF